MHSTDYHKDANDNWAIIYTTEQWFRAMQLSKMDYDRIAKLKSNSLDSTFLRNDFVRNRWFSKSLWSNNQINSDNMRIEHKKFQCIECNTKFDTYAENCLACGANILKSEDIQRTSTYLMLIILSLSSLSTLLYFMENDLINIFSGVFGLIAAAALYKLFQLDWDR